ncbi:MAG TPA: rhodanese-like domain-containing protein [Alcanivoracaceae bacterium]|nr:rhodanese-like domain-containing protein [Alcanivoracaceae bacterium]
MRRRRRNHPNEIDHGLAELWLTAPRTHFVDLRDAASFSFRRIQGAISVSHSNVDTFLANTPKNTDLILYCYNGNVSRYAMDFFRQQGFTYVYSLMGGFEAWRKRYPEYTTTD